MLLRDPLLLLIFPNLPPPHDGEAYVTSYNNPSVDSKQQRSAHKVRGQYRCVVKLASRIWNPVVTVYLAL